MSDLPLSRAIDEYGVVHLTWIRKTHTTMASLCSTIQFSILVDKTEREFVTCLRCIDIDARFW